MIDTHELAPHSGKLAASAFLAAVILMPGSAAAGTVTLTGKGTYFVSRDLMPLGNGGAAVHITNTTVVSVQPSETGVMFGECAGLAYLAPDASYTSHIYCNFTENGKDVFVIEGEMSPDGGAIKVVGGSGKWASATGTGTVTPNGEQDDQGLYSYEFQITTP